MGCKTCKQKKQKEEYSQNNDDTINLIPQEIIDGNYNGNFFFKLIAFFTIIIAIPFILLVLLCQLFISFFLPKSLPKVSNKFKAFMMKIFTFYAEFKVKRELKKRDKQFKENRGYEEGSELIDIEDIEVYKDNNKKK